MNKLLLCLALCLTFMAVFSVTASAQNAKGGIKGTIQSDDGYPLIGISVQLENAGIGTTTDANGTYEIKGIEPGTYVLIVSGISYKTRKENIVIKDGILYLDFSINIATNTLEEVTVRANQAAPYIDKSTSTGLRQNMPLLEIPHSISVVTQQIIKDQQIVDFQQTLRNVTGVQPSYAGGGYQMVQKARGFEQRTYFRDGIAFTSNNIRDMSNIEQVEVMRGPSGTLYGGSNINGPGALINIVTKKPLENFYGAVGITGGTRSFFRPTFDISTPLNSSKTALFRINASVETDKGFQDTYSRNSFFVAPSFTYKLSNKTSLSLDGEYFARNEHEISYPIPLDVIPVWPREINPTNDEGFSKTKTFAGTVKINHTINNNWQMVAALQFTGQSLDHASAGAYMSNDTLADRYLYTRQSNYSTYAFQYNINGKFNTGRIEHSLIAGVDGYLFKENYYRNGNFIAYDVVNLKSGKFPAIPLASYDKTRWRSVLVDGDNGSKGIYVQDVIKLIPAISIILGGRVDWYKKYDEKNLVSGTKALGFNQTAISPKVGLVYQPILHKLSVFGNYTSGFQFQSGRDFNGTSFKPVGYNQIEGGIKAELAQGRFIPTFTVYQIKAVDVVRTDAAHPGFSIQDGEQKSNGWELEMAGSPAKGLNIVAGYADNKSIFTKANASVEGKSPNAMPRNVLNAWLSYSITKGGAKGLGLGIGANYTSDCFLLPDNIAVVPAYTIYNAALFYTKPSYRLSVKFDNLTDKYYYIATYGSVTPGQSRRILTSVNIYF